LPLSVLQRRQNRSHLGFSESGRRESNPRSQLGKPSKADSPNWPNPEICWSIGRSVDRCCSRLSPSVRWLWHEMRSHGPVARCGTTLTQPRTDGLPHRAHWGRADRFLTSDHGQIPERSSGRLRAAQLVPEGRPDGLEYHRHAQTVLSAGQPVLIGPSGGSRVAAGSHGRSGTGSTKSVKQSCLRRHT
jgi:hypothetical protein